MRGMALLILASCVHVYPPGRYVQLRGPKGDQVRCRGIDAYPCVAMHVADGYKVHHVEGYRSAAEVRRTSRDLTDDEKAEYEERSAVEWERFHPEQPQ